MRKSIFIFRRDLRLDDNNGLLCALNNSDIVIPIFIFTKTQLSSSNKYKSERCVQFMIESLEELDGLLRKKGSKLWYFYASGDEASIIKKLIRSEDITQVYVNMDYTPYSVERDTKIKRVCDENKVQFISVEDILLHPVNSVMSGSGSYYKKFTPYYRAAKKFPVKFPVKNNHSNYLKRSNKLPDEYKKDIHKFYKDTNLKIDAGHSNGLKLLSKIKNQKDYNKKRDYLTFTTTRLSPHNKFGTVSIRHVYHTIYKNLGSRNDLIKQLYWRDFFYNVTYNSPHVLSLGGNRNFNKKYIKVKWVTYSIASQEQKRWFEAWKTGTTGYPVVDAAMRELNNTGFMHNRGRLIVSSFLCKIIGWHWKDGERYFATKLIDYDPSQNSGGWQWSAGSGVDAQPYFRIFNPYTQALTYDPKCEYIKKWVPELKNIDNKYIHHWYKYHDTIEHKYYNPIFDYEEQRDKARKIYKF